jgi:antitoxin component YwqK of YwqJK toxin-antitoxin module
MNGSNNGYWEFYWKNGNVWMKGYYVNTEHDGYWEYYNRSGELIRKEYILR